LTNYPLSVQRAYELWVKTHGPMSTDSRTAWRQELVTKHKDILRYSVGVVRRSFEKSRTLGEAAMVAPRIADELEAERRRR